MAEGCTEGSVITSSSAPPNWWEIHHASSLSSMSTSCDEDISMSTSSFTNASNHSGLTIDSSHCLVEPPSSNHFINEHTANNQLWSQVLLNVGSNGELPNNPDIGENILETMPAKSLFDPACDYLKKIDSTWEFTNLNGFSSDLLENDRLINLSDISLNSSMNQYSQTFSDCAVGTNGSSFCDSNGVGYQSGLINSSFLGDGSKYVYKLPDSPCTSTARNFANVLTLSSRIGRPLMDLHAPRPSFRSLNLSDSNRRSPQISYQTRINGRGHGITAEGKKKRSEETSETVLKKPKHENSTVNSSAKQAPKVKLGDRITALQQIVSPFGKTDTASVLLEAIGYIKFLQEQVQLLSNPYMKSNPQKDLWGALERKDKGDHLKLDLKSRGLCLVPISCTPQVYRENTGSDYWTPTYRGCLYR